MRAAVVTSLDGPEAVQVKQIADPEAGEDAVVIDVHAAGVNYPDLLQTRGRYQWKPDLPFVMGSEIAGTVRHAPDAASVVPGDRVVALCARGGGFAEVAEVPPDAVFRLPDSVSLAAGAGLVVNDLTVHFALTERVHLIPGQDVLVHGAAGGIGTSTIRIASALEAERIIAVVSSPEKAEVALRAGATHVMTLDSWLTDVRRLTADRGVDLVVDPVGGSRFTDSLRSLAPGGNLLVVGFVDGDIPTVKVNRLLLKNISVAGIAWGEWVATHPGFLSTQWTVYRSLLDSGQLKVPEPTMYPLEGVTDALLAIENRSARGKIVLTMR